MPRVGLLLLVSLVSASQVPAQNGGTWAVSTVVARDQDDDSEREKLLWLGLQNRSESLRMLCMYAWSHSIGPPMPRSARAEGAVHACRDIKDFSLVLPGETHFVRVSIEFDEIEDSSKLRIVMAFTEADLGNFTRRRQFRLQWEGTLSEAVVR